MCDLKIKKFDFFFPDGPAREIAALFMPHRARPSPYPQASQRRRNQKEKTWTGNFFLFSETQRNRVANPAEKELLGKRGLGFQRVQLYASDNSEEVYNKLMVIYPALKGCGGFELMRCHGNSRTLTAINSSWAASTLKTYGNQGTFYIRPIQRDLILPEESGTDDTINVEEPCLKCGQRFVKRDLRNHYVACQSSS